MFGVSRWSFLPIPSKRSKEPFRTPACETSTPCTLNISPSLPRGGDQHRCEKLCENQPGYEANATHSCTSFRPILNQTSLKRGAPIAIILMSIGCTYPATAAAQAAASGFRSTPAPVRSSDGLALLQNVLTALGDANGLHASQSCVIATTMTLEGHAPVSIDWTMEPNNSLMTTHGPNGPVDVGSRAPYTLAGKTFAPSDRLNRARFIPAAAPIRIAAAFSGANYSVGSVIEDTLDGKPVLIVYMADAINPIIARDSLQTWYFDPGSFLPLRVDYRIASPSMSGVGKQAHVLFSGFQSFAVGLFPATISLYTGDSLSSKTTVSSAKCSPQLHPVDLFQVHGRSAQ